MSDIYIPRTELRVDPYMILEQNADNKYLEILQDLTKDLIDLACHQSFDKVGTDLAPTEERTDGNGEHRIQVPKRLLKLNKVRIYSNSTNYTDYNATEFNNTFKSVTWNIYSTSAISARYQIENFPEGLNNIGIFGTWGYEAVPNGIKYVQGRLIQKLISDGEFANKFSSSRAGDFSYSQLIENDKIFGDAELDFILRPYNNWLDYAII